MNLFTKFFQIKTTKVHLKLDRFNQEANAIQKQKILVKSKTKTRNKKKCFFPKLLNYMQHYESLLLNLKYKILFNKWQHKIRFFQNRKHLGTC